MKQHRRNVHTVLEEAQQDLPHIRAALVERTQQMAQECQELFEQVGLPWIDKSLLEAELADPRDVALLPRVERLLTLLKRQAAFATQIRAVFGERSVLLGQLAKTCCLCEKAPCDVDAHKAATALLRRIDLLTEQLVQGVMQWREGLHSPLPFIVEGENILLAVAQQCAVGGQIPMACGHIRATSRHMPFYYASSFDTVNANAGLPEMTVELKYILSEWERQHQHCTEQLTLSRMGIYTPKLRFRLRGCKPSFTIPINDIRWKRQLTMSYSSALRLLESCKPNNLVTSAVTNAATQFLLISARSLHIRYYRLWVDWLSSRKEVQRRVQQMQRSVVQYNLLRRFDAWLSRTRLSKVLRAKCRQLSVQIETAFRRRHMQQWYKYSQVSTVSRGVRRAIYMRYYNRMYLAVAWRKLRSVPFSDHQHLIAMRHARYSGCPHLRALVDVATVLRPFFELARDETDDRARIAKQKLQDVLGATERLADDSKQRWAESLEEQHDTFLRQFGDTITSSTASVWVVLAEPEHRRFIEVSWRISTAAWASSHFLWLCYHVHMMYFKGAELLQRQRIMFFQSHRELCGCSELAARRQALLCREDRAFRGIIRSFFASPQVFFYMEQDERLALVRGEVSARLEMERNWCTVFVS